jgi:type IV pilus assembly protein PilP
MIRIILLALLLHSGCGNEEFEDLREFVRTSGDGMRGKIPPPPEVKPYEPFVYSNEANLPDPFKARKPELRSTGGGVNQPDMFRPKEALEEFPLESLTMVGYLNLNNVATAVIRDPEGKLHRVKVGNYIGSNFGQILEVTEEETKIKEMVQDSVGEWSERASSLTLIQ